MERKGFRRSIMRWAPAGISLLILAGFLFSSAFELPPTGAVFSLRAAEAGESSLSPWPHEGSDLKPDPALVFGRLKNGFRYVLMENHTPKNRVSMHLDIQAGSLHEKEDQAGLAHFLEHMMFNGTTHFQPGEMVKYFQSIGMQFGPDANAHTGFDETVYDVLLPDGKRETMEKALLVMKDYAEGALLLASEVDRERRVILAEKRTRDSASYRTFVATMGFEFAGSRIPERLPIGEEEVIQKADRELLKSFYDTWYRPDRMILVMVGDFKPADAVPLIEEKLAGMTPRTGAVPEPEIGKIDHQGVKTFYHPEKEAGNTTVSLETVRTTPPEPDSLSLQKRLLIQEMAHRIVQNRLDAMLRKPDTPFTAASVGAGRYLDHVEYAEISAESSPENWEKSLSAIEQVLRQALGFGFSEAERLRVQKEFLTRLETAADQASTRNSRDMAREIIRNLNSNRVILSPAQEKALFSPVVESASLETLNDAFRKAWDADHRLVLVTGNAHMEKAGEKPEDVILATYVQSRNSPVTPRTEGVEVAFPYFPEPGKAGRVSTRMEIPELGIVQVNFENGVRLNLKKTDFEAGQVLFNLSFGGGRASEPLDKPGLSELARDVINESGLGTLDKESLDRALAGKSTRLSFKVEEDDFQFDGKTVTGEILLTVQLLHAHLTDPAYRESAFTFSRQRFEQRYRSLARSIDGAMELNVRRFLSGGDSRFGLPSPEKFQELRLDHVRDWIDPILRKGLFEISMVGDLDTEAVIRDVSSYLGGLDREALKNDPRQGLPDFPEDSTLRIGVETEIPKSLVLVAYPTDDFWDIGRTRRLSVLADIFSERLRESVREKLGAAYSPYAFNRSSRAYPGYGLFQALVHVNPPDAQKVAEEIRKISSELAVQEVAEDELKRSLDPILTGIRDLRRTNGYWLGSVLIRSVRYPQQIDWARTMEADYARINREEIRQMAARYLNNRLAATILVEPEEGVAAGGEKK